VKRLDQLLDSDRIRPFAASWQSDGDGVSPGQLTFYSYQRAFKNGP
jgi:hypothetical protein